ncbi:hypothetical protein [Paraflavitalea sp. CAU 1676]|uniref:hypothetical protein n=1 Tax=Paraflavitalea sp. CAU 1676 TaxID=3032598 RepID=UPI0023DA9452|nr:hypothetical protein [Paraflavitalea sp. CAU 1676]MDF2187535.1 hypothetical protein [Paraflavitalea sp. CAU 1676]
MRTTWLILLAMVLAGIAMYYLANRKKPLAPFDSISIINTPDSIRQKLRLYVAYDPAEVTFRDSAWFEHDSIPLKEISLRNTPNSFDKNYQKATFFLDYDHRYFYDIEVQKPAPDAAYELSFAVDNALDTFRIQGIINDPERDQLRLTGPMMQMYQAFVLTYNSKMPPRTDSTDDAPPATPASRTITVVKK